MFRAAELRGGFEHVRDEGQELRDNLRVISREPPGPGVTSTP